MEAIFSDKTTSFYAVNPFKLFPLLGITVARTNDVYCAARPWMPSQLHFVTEKAEQ
jgi:hypothetical protein